MHRLVALAVLSAFASPAPAQFVRPPVPLPPPPVRPIPTFPHQNPAIPHPPITLQQPPYTNQPRPLRIVPPSFGLLAVVGGVYATHAPVYAPEDVIVIPARQAVNWPALHAVVGSAGIPWAVPQPVTPPPRQAVIPAPPANNDPAWMALGLIGAVGLAGIGVAVAVRPRRGRVRITDVPPGEAPEWVRRAWVGVELPTLNREPKTLQSWQVSTRRSAGTPSGFAVDGATAVRVLREANPDAAEWWRANVPEVLRPGYQLVFPAEVCERLV